MKNLAFILFLGAMLLGQSTYAQAPHAFKYQAVIRDASGAPIANSTVTLRVDIHRGSPTGPSVYQETNLIQTNSFGLLSRNVGEGQLNLFAAIDWSNGPYYLETLIDPNGNNSYSISGVSELVSVPTALYANAAAFSDSADISIHSLYSDTAYYAIEAEHARQAEVADSVRYEQDPVFGQSAASTISLADISDWNAHIVNDGDLDPSNELQTLGLVGDTLSLTGGGQVILPNDMDWIRGNGIVYNTTDFIGVGTNQPSSNLDVEGSFQFVDGNEKEGRFLRSDSLGNARWDTLKNPETFAVTTPNWSYSGTGQSEFSICSLTLTLTRKSLVVAYMNGHIRALVSSGSHFVAGILFDGEVLAQNGSGVYWDHNTGVFSNSTNTNNWIPCSLTRSKVFEPGTYTIRLVIGSYIQGSSFAFNGGSLRGHIIPFN